MALTVNWDEVPKERNALAGTTSQRFRKRSNYKDNGIRLLLLSVINAVEKDNEKCVCSVAQLCVTLCAPVDCSPPNSSVHGIF